MTTSASSALEFKGSMQTLMVLYLSATQELPRLLAEKIAEAPGMFQFAPVIIDLQKLSAAEQKQLHLEELTAILKQHQLIPIGVRNGCSALHQQAEKLGLSVLPESKTEKSKAPRRKQHTPPEEEQALALPAAKVIAQPVRSGQQIVAPQGDLVILSAVSAGAEVLAVGNIHVYGALRGRALAGFSGNVAARIFCHQFDAELVAVAGHYQVNEDFRADVRNTAVQVYLTDETLHIEAF